MPVPLIHDRARSRPRGADAHTAIGEACAHLDRALEHHAKHLHGHVKTAVEDAQRCLQRVIGAKPATVSGIANPTGNAGAQTSAGQSSRATTRAERREELQRLMDAAPK
jgi:hypothetical protein